MPINQNRAVFSGGDLRHGHHDGLSYASLARGSAARLDTTILPDETGTQGCGFGLNALTPTVMIANTVYAVYLGRATGKPLSFLSVVTTTGGTGAASGAAGFATTAAAPDFTDKIDLTVRAVASIDTTPSNARCTAAPVVVGTNKFTPAVGVQLWAFVITNNATTQATVAALTGDVGAGAIHNVTGQTVAACVVGKVYTTAARPAASVTAIQSPQFFVV